MQKRKSYLRKMIFCAILISLQIILKRYMGIQTPIHKFGFGWVAIALSGMLLGPWWAAGCALISDLLGTLISGDGAYNPMFSINMILYALIYAWFFYKKPKTPLRVVLCVLVQLVCVELPLTPLWLYIYHKYVTGLDKAFWTIFSAKAVFALIEVPIKIAILIPLGKYLCPRLEKTIK